MSEAQWLPTLHAEVSASFMMVPLIVQTYNPEVRTLKLICRELRVNVNEIIGPRRFGGTVRKRQAAMLICSRLLPHLNDCELGRLFNRDRTTVRYGIQRAESEERRSEFSRTVNARILARLAYEQ